MVQNAEALVLYLTAPHIDVFETGQRGAAVLKRILVGAQPLTTFGKLPLVVPAERANTQDPTSISFGIRELLQQWEREPNVLAAGLATVQPWLDIPELGSAIVIVTDGEIASSRALHDELANRLRKDCCEYLPQLISIEEGVRIAFEQQEGLVVLSDSADATTSGAPGDSNHLLREMLKYDWPRPALVTLVDPELVAAARQLGVGAEFSASLGGKRDQLNSQPLSAVIRVAHLFDARFVMSGHLARNLPIDMGPAAVLRLDNIYVVVTSGSGPHFSPQLFQAAGIDPFAAKLLVAKSPCGFRAAYEGRAKHIHVVRAPGCAPTDFWNYPYHNISHPLWPWDEITGWSPKALRSTQPL
jgi:microcystin degradation protein MlrC